MNKDELIQNQIESGCIPEGTDAEAYRVVFSAVRKEPSLKLPDDFVVRVSSIALTSKKTFDWDKLILFGGLGIFVFVLGYVVAITGFKISFGKFSFLASHAPLISFAIVFILFLNWLDKRLIGSRKISH
ncbi:MAG: hypothetical protein JST43_08110 [Bacteroidetes bacterium]|nr:hypothetical protein [Bacteroidota bacterium]MBS1539210.1 hypothetical protein [Bacteroidota bacterium]